MLKRIAVLIAVAISMTAGLSGCIDPVPSHWSYEMALAKIGDSYWVYAPLCDGENLVSFRVLDSRALQAHADPDEVPDDSTTDYDYWNVSGPSTPEALRGLVRIGDDDSFGAQNVSIEANSTLPAEWEVVVVVENENGTQRFTKGLDLIKDVPSYEEGIDPAAVEFAFEWQGDNYRWTPAEILEKSGCASQYPY